VGVYQVDPLQDPRWPAFLERHPRASVFHTPAWLELLRRTYGYEPTVLTMAAPEEELSNGLVYCRVKSWFTGRRMVSLPFSDHCDPLVETGEELRYLLSALKRDLAASRGKYLEIRPLKLPRETVLGLDPCGSFCLHELDLHADLQEIFKGFHKDCIQRKIRRAEREALSYQEGRSEWLLAGFYEMLVGSRRRQRLAPQPLSWFRNLIACMGERLKIRLALKEGRPVAGILTLRYKDTLVYKYGCSDKKWNKLGGMPLLFWKAIQEAKRDGISKFDLGRSDWNNPGLIAFKDRWGAGRTTISYWRYGTYPIPQATAGWQNRVARHIFGHMPNAFLPLAGSLMYRHLG
jgi:lipid II:glycine glycyltransferase (peptidoglycan interpeptide bridge formation enzyme)